MSGRGLVSVRLPESLSHELRLSAQRRGLKINDLARTSVKGLVGIGGSQIREVPEPPLESTNPRVSLYLGEEGLRVLNAAAMSSGLSPSSVLRRVLNAALTTRLPSSVQHLAEESEHSLSYVWILIAVVLTIVSAILSAIARTQTASAQQKGMS
jgi:hypothetical protein